MSDQSPQQSLRSMDANNVYFDRFLATVLSIKIISVGRASDMLQFAVLRGSGCSPEECGESPWVNVVRNDYQQFCPDISLFSMSWWGNWDLTWSSAFAAHHN